MCRLGGGRAERRAEEEIAQRAIGHRVRCIECGLRQLVGKDIVVVAVTIFRLIENAVSSAEYSAVAEGR